jgi:hypothetical protein
MLLTRTVGLIKRSRSLKTGYPATPDVGIEKLRDFFSGCVDRGRSRSC